jgi:hypothetical protein
VSPLPPRALLFKGTVLTSAARRHQRSVERAQRRISARSAYAARVRESQLVTRATIFLGVNAMRGDVFSEPDHGLLYRWAKRIPLLGAGMRIGEAVNVCVGWTS